MMALEREEFLEHMRLVRGDIQGVRDDVKDVHNQGTNNRQEIALLKGRVRRVELADGTRRRSWLAAAVAVASAIATGLVEYFAHGGHR